MGGSGEKAPEKETDHPPLSCASNKVLPDLTSRPPAAASALFSFQCRWRPYADHSLDFSHPFVTGWPSVSYPCTWTEDGQAGRSQVRL